MKLANPPGAQFEILVDGKARSYRDIKAVAIASAEFLKSRNPHSEVAVKDLQSGGGYRRDRGVGPLMSLEGGQGPVQDQLGSMEGLGKPREAGLGRTLMCSAKLSWMHHCA